MVIALFIIVLSQKSPSQMATMASKTDLQSLDSTVGNLSLKMKQIERDTKKATTCETGWQPFKGSCYFFTNLRSNWMKARSSCVIKGADLAVITSEEEQNFISRQTGDQPYWIGLNDIEEEGKWTWVDGTDYASSYKAWMPNQPSDSDKNEDCAHLLSKGKWNDNKCSHAELMALCEKKLGA
ncbi:unnamed protein product [Staurois parvus]|uniref:C-type lectin domain-containing protein n=1 Tax=Staurois parvus TaxID=386267 RepID=A0ABN9FS65_9NEOB|nr:unnamed protein product [Staurois parvus]